jgi:hypothetical protein
MSFLPKTIKGESFIDMLKLSPHGTYLSDLALKLLCAAIAPELILDNSRSPLQTLCLVPMAAIQEEIGSFSAAQEAIRLNLTAGTVLREIRNQIDDTCELGLIGRHALDPACSDTELDVSLIASDLTQLHHALHRIRQMERHGESSWVRHMWPLTTRTKAFGIIDWFFCTVAAPSEIHATLSQAPILNPRYEFVGTIVDDSMAILSTPLWRLDDGTCLITVDGALRGRYCVGDRVAGIGLLAASEHSVVVIQSNENISLLR